MAEAYDFHNFSIVKKEIKKPTKWLCSKWNLTYLQKNCILSAFWKLFWLQLVGGTNKVLGLGLFESWLFEEILVEYLKQNIHTFNCYFVALSCIWLFHLLSTIQILNVGRNKEHQNFWKWLTLIISVISVSLKWRWKSLQNDYVQNETRHVCKKNLEDNLWTAIVSKIVAWKIFANCYRKLLPFLK